MKKRILTLIMIGFLLKAANGYATTDPVTPDYQKNRSEFEHLQKNVPNSVLLNGEIIDINHREILINSYNENNDLYRLKLDCDTKFYCNGIGSGWEALVPVAPEAYFEARIIMDGQEAIAVNAFYYGEECIVRKCFQSQGKFVIELISALSEKVFVAQVNQKARLPVGENWKHEGQVVYVLFNEEEEVRAVFLPD